MLLGAYRDNEVFPAHSLLVCLRELEKQQTAISTITLAPLSIGHVNQLVAETLSCTIEIATPLTDLIYQKTKGNPFFTTQFLKGLHEDALIAFNQNLGYWECDLVQVRDAAITDDVVAFMAGRLYKLPEATQKILKLAACIGNQFDLDTLAIVCEAPLEDVAADLWKALREGLILPLSDAYKFFQDGKQEKAIGVSVGYRFLHDRVQQAAYFLIPEQQKQITHYQIGKLLLQYISPDKWEEKIFDIVNQLNQAISLAVTQPERKQLAELNLIAGKKAIAATAYAAATKYLEISAKCLDTNSWESHYKLTLSVYEATIKAEYLNINFARAQALSNFVSEKTTSILDRVKLYELQIQMYMAQAEMTKALEVGISALELLEIDLNHAPKASTIQLPELSTIASLPMMQDAHQIMVMRILGAIFAPSYTTQPELLFPISLGFRHLHCQAWQLYHIVQ
jgi:predicted ATPase